VPPSPPAAACLAAAGVRRRTWSGGGGVTEKQREDSESQREEWCEYPDSRSHDCLQASASICVDVKRRARAVRLLLLFRTIYSELGKNAKRVVPARSPPARKHGNGRIHRGWPMI
jgi:hypothetical protein